MNLTLFIVCEAVMIILSIGMGYNGHKAKMLLFLKAQTKSMGDRLDAHGEEVKLLDPEAPSSPGMLQKLMSMERESGMIDGLLESITNLIEALR